MKKCLSFFFAGFLTLSFAITALAAFSDVTSSNQFYSEINWLSQNGVIRGYADGTFRPNATVNRAELLKIAFLALELSGEVEAARAEMTQSKIGFPDVDINQWYAPYVYLAKKRGSVQGYADGTFRPGNPVKRSEAFKIALNEFYNNQINFVGTSQVSDVSGSLWFWKYANFAASRDLIDGSIFNGGFEMTRGSTAELVYRTKAVKDNSAILYTAAVSPLPIENIVAIQEPPASTSTGGTTGGTIFSAGELLSKVETALPGSTVLNIKQAGHYAVFFSIPQDEDEQKVGWYRLLLDRASQAEKFFATGYRGYLDGAVSPDGKQFLGTSGDGKVVVIDIATLAKTELGTFLTANGASKYKFPVFTPDGKYFILLDERGGGFSPQDGLLVVSAVTKNIAAGTFVAGFWTPEGGGGGYENGETISNYTFLENNRVRFIGGSVLNLSTMTKE